MIIDTIDNNIYIIVKLLILCFLVSVVVLFFIISLLILNDCVDNGIFNVDTFLSSIYKETSKFAIESTLNSVK